MKKIITENPEGMVEHMHNFVFVKDKEAFVRDGDNEISLVDYIRKWDKELYGIEYDDKYCNAEEFGDFMDDDRFTCVMYMALVGFVEVREHLKEYEKNVDIARITEIIARNLTAWDTSKDKKEGLLPEVYLANMGLYKQLTGVDYNFRDACKRFHIGE